MYIAIYKQYFDSKGKHKLLFNLIDFSKVNAITVLHRDNKTEIQISFLRDDILFYDINYRLSDKEIDELCEILISLANSNDIYRLDELIELAIMRKC